MFEYKVLALKVRNAQNTMNDLAKEGWKVIAVCPNIDWEVGLIVTFEREKG